jgi:hypothetical protein
VPHVANLRALAASKHADVRRTHERTAHPVANATRNLIEFLTLVEIKKHTDR